MLTPLSVVVPTRNRPAHLAACLAALSESARREDEIVVAALEEPGASRARNAGWRRAAHDLVAFVDDDVRVERGWADAMRGAFTDPSVAFVTGRLAADAPAERPVAVKDDPVPARLDRSTTGTLGHAANLAVRRSALEAIGGFDERLGPGTPFRAAEDLDLFDRLLAAGFVGRYEPDARAVHVQWRRRRELVALDWGYGVGVGARLAKLAATDRSRLRSQAREWVWRAGVRDGVVGAARAGHELAVVLALVRLAGTAAGFTLAAPRHALAPPAAARGAARSRPGRRGRPGRAARDR